MIDYANAHFPLLKLGSDGESKLSHLKAVSKRTAVPELDYDAPHDDVRYLLDAMYMLRGSSGGKVSYQEISAYKDVSCVNLCGWEVDVIMTLDSIMERSLNV